MEKEASKLEADINWIKPDFKDKGYPKKSQPLVTFLNSYKNEIKTNMNFSQNPVNNNYCNEISKSFDHDTNSGLFRMKDLCPDDKQRIANLIKELAKVAEEKNQLERLLEEERKLKDNKIKEVVKQHQVLLHEKDKLLNKYKKTCEKLDQLKRHQDLKNKLESESLSSKPSNAPVQFKADQKNKNPFNVNPHKSSTPVSQSPRNLSPIPLRSSSASSSENDQKQKSNEELDLNRETLLNENESSKKIELIKQRMDLMTEQKQLRELMDQQEKLLKEKQDQIIMQQRLHQERLEQLVQIRKFELEHYKQQQIASSIIGPNSLNQQDQFDNTHEDKNTDDKHNNSVLIEKIAQEVYKQLHIKRKNSTTVDELLDTSSNHDRIIGCNEQQLFKRENKLEKMKNIDKLVQTNSGRVRTKIKQEVNKNSLIIGDKQKEVDDDLEESKLIEDLFFLNKF